MGGEDMMEIATTSPKNGSVSLIGQSKYTEMPVGIKDTLVAMASLEAASDQVNGSKRVPIDLICVIDKSGSMTGTKLDLVKKTMDFVFRQLSSDDRFALVTYDSGVTTDLALTKMDIAGQDAATKALGKVVAGSYTNLSGGLFEGLKLADSRQNPADVCSVLLFTDGLANEGISDKDALTAALAKRMETSKTSVFTFGFGSDHDASMLQSLAQVGRGIYYFIEDVDRIPTAFADALGGLQSVVAQNIKLTITPAPGITIIRVHNIKYRLNGTVPSSGTLSVELGDIFDGEKKDILFEVELSPSEPTPEMTVAVIAIEYFNLSDARDIRVETPVKVACLADVPKERPINELVDAQLIRVMAALAIKEAQALADRGDFPSARKAITSVRTNITEQRQFMSPSTSAYVGQMESELASFEDGMSSSVNYQQNIKHKMASREMAHAHQRSNKTWATTNGEDEEDVYVTSVKSKMMKAALKVSSPKP